MVNERDVEVFIVCLSCHFDMGAHLYHWAGGTLFGVLNDTHMLTMTRTYLGPKLGNMWCMYSYLRGVRLSIYDLSII
jgi:hypothetical protein